MKRMTMAEMRVKIRTPIGLLLVLAFIGERILSGFETGRELLGFLPSVIGWLANPQPSIFLCVAGFLLILWEVHDIRKAGSDSAKRGLRHLVRDSLLSLLGLLTIITMVGFAYLVYVRFTVKSISTTSSPETEIQRPPSATPPETASVRAQAPAKTGQSRVPSQTMKGAPGGVTAGNITQGSGSITQVGGVGNRASIINGPQLRFSEQRIEELANLLSAHPGAVSIDVRNADSITNRDAINLLTAFAKAGWGTQGVGQLIHGTDIGANGLPIPDPTGIHIYARLERAVVAESLREALKKFGIEPHMETDETVTGVDIRILVGASE